MHDRIGAKIMFNSVLLDQEPCDHHRPPSSSHPGHPRIVGRKSESDLSSPIPLAHEIDSFPVKLQSADRFIDQISAWIQEGLFATVDRDDISSIRTERRQGFANFFITPACCNEGDRCGDHEGTGEADGAYQLVDQLNFIERSHAAETVGIASIIQSNDSGHSTLRIKSKIVWVSLQLELIPRSEKNQTQERLCISP